MKPTLNFPVSSSRSLTVTVMAALLLNGLAMGAVLPKATIDNPCRTIDTVNQVFPPLDSQFNEAINEVNAVKVSAEQLITALQGDGFLTSDDIPALNPTFSHLPGLPLRLENDNPNLDNMVNILLQDYHDISVYIVYVKQALQEQVALDMGLLSNEISQLETNLFSLMCKVYTLLKTKETSVTSYVDASAMPEYLKNIEDATTRYMRNYLLAKDAKIFLNHLGMNYASFLNALQV
ncbi:hypothetical protein PoB_006076500 [Plakobranchus ocellatus]|uniref:Uncharacterized protein n=1 Tax=Plakobranchus ocellatus TaxID=259542 RepID=A0AAV4CQT4_9GAST|nr:hypothetical protein PoB_006076500 [Plakobranchus ocellatus]